MGTSLIQFAMVLATATIVVNGVVMKAPDILASANSAVGAANVHQLSTALELYYLDHNSYPVVSNGTQMVDTLYTGGYIQSKPADSSIFQYEEKNNGNDYSLTVQ